MKKSALLRKVSAETGVPYSTVKKVMDSALEHIAGSLGTGERVVLSGFGTFALRPYRARQWVNPQTGQQVDIPAALRPGFVTSAALKRRLAGAPHGAGAQTSDNGGGGDADMASITTRSRRAATSMRQVRTRKHGSQAAQMNNGK
jgi:DNA-binding protein HU-beta